MGRSGRSIMIAVASSAWVHTGDLGARAALGGRAGRPRAPYVPFWRRSGAVWLGAPLTMPRHPALARARTQAQVLTPYLQPWPGALA